MNFIADDMLGRLAKWLRILGYDVAYPVPISDAELLRRARAEGRILLTRDTKLIARCHKEEGLFIQSDALREQLQQVIEARRLDVGAYVLSRCLVCNEPIQTVEKETVKDRIPEHVYKEHATFQQCSRCGRIYWPGSHVQRMLHTLSEIADLTARTRSCQLLT